MTTLRSFVLLMLVFASQITLAQNLKKADKITLANLQNHVHFLADDKLEGRRAGTPGEGLAMNYIADQFRKIGLQPKGIGGYFQPFDINDGKKIGSATRFVINGQALTVEKDYFPFAYSPNVTIEALPAIAVQESDMPWFIDLKEPLDDNVNNPHFDLKTYIHEQAVELKKKGATALVFYNTSPKSDELIFDGKDRSEMTKIPVIYITKPAAKRLFTDPSASIDMKLKIDIGEKKRVGHNVIGYIDNGMGNTVVLGAHFDHLGYGEDGNSMIRTGEKSIHNGADDNASGTAALIELARLIKSSKVKNNNYVFIAFSGEELGLYGSKHFVETSLIDLGKVNYMINMDMIGRLNDSTKVLTVGGYGTSPQWGSLVKTTNKKSPFVIKVDSSGTGPSDHTSFYRKDIPVLFFFTGLHTDYHKPSDDFDKINFRGQLDIVNYIYNLVASGDKLNKKYAFTKTREMQTTSSARFSVSLGIMPDYTYSGSGVRVDGVSEGKAAQKAGLKTGDVILQLGEFNVSSLENYMQALSKFKKGDNTMVKFKRGNESLEATVQF